jgi:hypothetical protein
MPPNVAHYRILSNAQSAFSAKECPPLAEVEVSGTIEEANWAKFFPLSSPHTPLSALKTVKTTPLLLHLGETALPGMRYFLGPLDGATGRDNGETPSPQNNTLGETVGQGGI